MYRFVVKVWTTVGHEHFCWHEFVEDLHERVLCGFTVACRLELETPYVLRVGIEVQPYCVIAAKSFW